VYRYHSKTLLLPYLPALNRLLKRRYITTMSVSRAFQLTTRNRRKALTYIFGATAFGTVLTVAGSEVLPCPARPNGSRRHADGPEGLGADRTVVEKRPRRWIEESRPQISG
jgi:cytochrome c oxidase assembly factor 2